MYIILNQQYKNNIYEVYVYSSVKAQALSVSGEVGPRLIHR